MLWISHFLPLAQRSSNTATTDEVNKRVIMKTKLIELTSLGLRHHNSWHCCIAFHIGDCYHYMQSCTYFGSGRRNCEIYFFFCRYLPKTLHTVYTDTNVLLFVIIFYIYQYQLHPIMEIRGKVQMNVRFVTFCLMWVVCSSIQTMCANTPHFLLSSLCGLAHLYMDERETLCS